MRCNDWCSESREEVIQGFSLPCYPQFTAATWRPQKLELQLNEMLENTKKDKTQNLQPLKHPVAKWQHEMILSCREEGGPCLKCLPVIQQNVWLPDALAGESHRVYAWIFWHVPLEVIISPFLWKTQTSHLKPILSCVCLKTVKEICMIWCITIRGTGKMQSRTNNNPEKTPEILKKNPKIFIKSIPQAQKKGK